MTKQATEEVQEEKTLKEVLSETYDSVMDETEELQPESESESESKPEPEMEQEKAEFAKEEPREEGKEGETGAADEDDVDLPSVEPPDAWPENAKSEFRSLSPKMQEFAVSTYKSMQADYTRKLQGISNIVHALGPIHQECVENGVTFDEAIRRFVGIHEKMKRNPNQTIIEIARLYGVDLPAVVTGGAVKDKNAPEAVPQVVQQKIEQIERELEMSRRQQFTSQAQALNAQVEEFKKTAPHYAAVEQKMIEIVNMHNAKGQALPPLKQIYDEACWLVPSVRQKLIAHEKAGGLAESVDDRRKKAEKAKNASRSIKQGSASVSKSDVDKPQSVRDTLSAVWDASLAKTK